MTALHTIEVEHEPDEDLADGTVRVRSIRFTCHAPAGVACKLYPSCGCEYWDADVHGYTDRDPEPGHEPVAQHDCWKLHWFEHGMDLDDLIEHAVLKDPAGENGECLEAYYYQDLIVSGPVQLVWSGEDEYYIELGGDVDQVPEPAS